MLKFCGLQNYYYLCSTKWVVSPQRNTSSAKATILGAGVSPGRKGFSCEDPFLLHLLIRKYF